MPGAADKWHLSSYCGQTFENQPIFFFFFNDTSPTDIYSLPLPDALPILLQLLSHSDGLTGVANRRFFSAQLEREFMRLQRLGEPLSLVMMDVDHFKAYNDHYGHLVGEIGRAHV